MADEVKAPTYEELVAQGLALPNIAINGDSGVGKTFALGTHVDWCERNGIEVFHFDIDNGLETLLGYWRDVGVPPFNRKEPAPIPKCLHWRQFHVAPVTLDQMVAAAKSTGELSYELLTKQIDTTRASTNPFWKILVELKNFKDDRTGKEFGPVDKFTKDQCFMFDNFTALSNAATKMQIGSRSTMAPPDYGVAQNHLMNFLRLLCHGTPAGIVMLFHAARDKNELTGMVSTMMKTVGTAIQPEIPPLFSEFLYAVREGNKFTWDMAAYGVTAKTRYLEYKSGLPPDLGVIMDRWKQRSGRK